MELIYAGPGCWSESRASAAWDTCSISKKSDPCLHVWCVSAVCYSENKLHKNTIHPNTPPLRNPLKNKPYVCIQYDRYSCEIYASKRSTLVDQHMFGSRKTHLIKHFGRCRYSGISTRVNFSRHLSSRCHIPCQPLLCLSSC